MSAKTRWATTKEDADVAVASEAVDSVEVEDVEVDAHLGTVRAVTVVARTLKGNKPAVTAITTTTGMVVRTTTVAKKAETAGEEDAEAV